MIFVFGNSRETINKLVAEARKGNAEAREKLISDHQQFVQKIVSKKTAGCEEIISRDEYSIGLMAFNEAIDSYKPGMRSFQSFAAMVIEKRLIDFYRSQSKHRGEALSLESGGSLPPGHDTDVAAERVHMKMEMEYFVKSLAEYSITLRELIDETPRHFDSRVMCLRIARALTGDSGLLTHFEKHRAIPVQGLSKRAGVNEKTIFRHRKYITAICLVLLSDLEAMKGYVESLIKGGDLGVR
jgi:RNA polymerase sigma factor